MKTRNTLMDQRQEIVEDAWDLICTEDDGWELECQHSMTCYPLHSVNDAIDQLRREIAGLQSKLAVAVDMAARAENARDAAKEHRPPLPSGMTREECVDGLKAIRDKYYALKKKKEDHFFARYPDYDALLEYIEAHGFPKP